MLSPFVLILLILSTVVYVWMYCLSVRPTALSRRMGDRSWSVCARIRYWCLLPMAVVLACYAAYLFFPLDTGLPRWFPWPWQASLGAALILSIPFGILGYKAMRDAGPETMRPDPSTPMYSGIYTKIRHPQALAEHAVWVLIGLATHSPFLALYSLVWIPAAVIMCRAEERDLVLRFGPAYERYRVETGMFIPRSARRR